jgi:hypothetical protein
VTALGVLLALAQQIEVGVDAHFQKTTGTLQFDERPTTSDRLSLEDDLGHHRFDLQGGIHARLSEGPQRGLLGYERWRSTWHHALEEPLVFDGRTIPPNEPIRHELDVDRWKTAYDHRVARGEAAELRAGLRAEYWFIGQIVDTPSLGRVDDHLGTLVVEPSVSAVFGPFGGVRVDADIAGIAYRVADHSVRAFEAQAVVHWSPTPFLEISAGARVGLFRFINIDPRQRNEVDLMAFGPLASLELRF